MIPSMRPLLLVMLIPFLASEIGLRILTGENSQWSILLGVDRQYDPVVQFRNKPPHRLAPGVVTNELGYIAPEGLRPEKAPGTLRLIYLGDSNTAAPTVVTTRNRSNTIWVRHVSTL